MGNGFSVMRVLLNDREVTLDEHTTLKDLREIFDVHNIEGWDRFRGLPDDRKTRLEMKAAIYKHFGSLNRYTPGWHAGLYKDEPEEENKSITSTSGNGYTRHSIPPLSGQSVQWPAATRDPDLCMCGKIKLTKVENWREYEEDYVGRKLTIRHARDNCEPIKRAEPIPGTKPLPAKRKPGALKVIVRHDIKKSGLVNLLDPSNMSPTQRAAIEKGQRLLEDLIYKPYMMEIEKRERETNWIKQYISAYPAVAQPGKNVITGFDIVKKRDTDTKINISFAWNKEEET